MLRTGFSPRVAFFFKLVNSTASFCILAQALCGEKQACKIFSLSYSDWTHWPRRSREKSAAFSFGMGFSLWPGHSGPVEVLCPFFPVDPFTSPRFRLRQRLLSCHSGVCFLLPIERNSKLLMYKIDSAEAPPTSLYNSHLSSCVCGQVFM